MPATIFLVLIGYILYGIYWVVINYWPFILAGAFCIWSFPKVARFVSEKWACNHTRLREHKERERSQNDLFSRFSDKDIKLRSFHWLYFLVVLIGFVVAYYSVLECYTFARHEGWIRSIPRDYRDVQFVVWTALFFLVTMTMFKVTITAFNCVRPNLELFASYKGTVHIRA